MRNTVQIAVGHDPLPARIDLFLAEAGLSGAPVAVRRQRLRHALALEVLSDAELAARGLRRDQIVGHVFRDLTGGRRVA